MVGSLGSPSKRRLDSVGYDHILNYQDHGRRLTNENIIDILVIIEMKNISSCHVS